MAAAAQKKIPSVQWINRAEVDKIVDAHAQRVLGISGKQFISKWKAGKFRSLDSDACPGVIELALIAPLPRRPRGRKDGKGSR